MAVETGDKWSNWLLVRRHAGNQDYQRVVQAVIERIRDRVLDAARLRPGVTLADIGSGDGLVAFGAIARVGPSLRVILTDVSPPLLAHAKQRAIELGVERQCTFLEGSAEKLEGIGDASVDAVTTRAALAYVADKAAALREFHRILKPGGIFSAAEPVFRDAAMEAVHLTALVRAQSAGAEPSLRDLLQRWKAAQYPSTQEEQQASPMANYSERDLVRFACQAGFGNVHLELHIDVRPSAICNWDVFLDVSPHPLAPTLRQIMATQFLEPERRLFESILRPRVESGQTIDQDVIVYFTAEKGLGEPSGST
jgi:ubiquinone/menaquinone biosynthesis C-methylase UbiE